AREALFKHKQRYYNQVNRYLNKQAEYTAINRAYDAIYYNIQLTIHYEPQIIEGEVSGTFQSEKDSLDKIALDLDDALTVLDVLGNVSNFEHIDQQLLVTLDRIYSQTEFFQINVIYQGKPDSRGQRYFTFDRMPYDNSDHLWTLSEPYGAKYWWPCKDTPQDKADSLDIIVKVPGNQKVASNGMLISTSVVGEYTQYHWKVNYPIATYLVSLAIADYYHFQDYYKQENGDSLLLDYYVYPSQATDAETVFGEMHDYMDAMIHYFGPYPFPDEKYGMAQFGWGGGMEHQTITSIGTVSPFWRYVYVHELGHQWFGDAVTCGSWTDIWLNEGFASYSEALYAEWAGYSGYPPGEDAYHAYMATQRYTNDGTIVIQDTTDFRNIFSRIVYDKGSWILHMLRHMMGDEIFFDVLKSYVYDFDWAYGSVRTENFQRVCEQKSGLDLDTFFDQWLNYPYFPIYQYEWDVIGWNLAGYQVEVNIKQEQVQPVYIMPMDLTFEFSDGSDTTVVVQNNQRIQKYQFTLDHDPQKMLLDPKNWILKESREAKQQAFTQTTSFHNIYPNPFTNTVNFTVQHWLQEELVIDIYNVLGQRVRRLRPNLISTPNYYFKWDGRNEAGQEMAAGVYFTRVYAPNKNVKILKTKKIIYMH
ncbi:MAG: T9SS type A sorting domain-containing protein, partial [Caldithrix sp.]|nr:T9SS type A sorting domain-containing protein [Caldithrix sp.]